MALLFVLTVFVSGCGQLQGGHAEQWTPLDQNSSELSVEKPRRVPISPPKEAPNLTLRTTSGHPFRLTEPNKPVTAMFFGYTSCPDVCPATLVELQSVYAGLGENADDVSFLFITVDPERDTEEKLAEYLNHFQFEGSLIGLTADEQVLAELYDHYGIYVERVEHEGGGYSVNHTSLVFLLDETGMLHVAYPFPIDVGTALEDIKDLLDSSENS